MTLREARQGRHRVVWDADRLDEPHERLFDPHWWRERDAIHAQAEGRGAAYFLDGIEGQPWVLRHNRRGGVIAHLNPDRFLWIGARRARPLNELRLLADMRQAALPVPAPVAARASRAGPVYRADVITVGIEGARPLADALRRGAMPATAWQALGGVVAGFHRRGVWHADLNARNILVDAAGDFHLIDFDKARVRAPGRWQEANLSRLRRSLDKFGHAHPDFNFREADWAALRSGYAPVFAAGR